MSETYLNLFARTNFSNCNKYSITPMARTRIISNKDAVLTSTHNLCFRAEIRKIMYTPVKPSFTV